jgi:putative ABC transport system permease protein
MMSLGASAKEVKSIFLKLGSLIGVIGIISGAIIGGIGIWILKTFDIVKLPADVYGVSKLPIELSLIDFFIIIIGAFIIVLLSSIYPAIKASKTDVLETLRYE